MDPSEKTKFKKKNETTKQKRIKRSHAGTAFKQTIHSEQVSNLHIYIRPHAYIGCHFR